MIRVSLLTLLITAFTSFGQVNHTIWMQSRMNGSLEMDGGAITQFWGYGLYTPPDLGGKILIPGPLLRYNEGDTLIVNMYNNSPEHHTIHWHGLDVDMENDGVPTTSAPVLTDSMRTYKVPCKKSGTYNYHCHVMTSLHLAMGMYGLFIIDPDDTRTRIYTNGPRYTKDYNWLASELNQNWSDNPLSPGLLSLYEPTYLMVNGKSGSQLHLGDDDVTGSITDSIAIRMANMGYGLVRYIFPADAHNKIYMSDGRPLPNIIESDTVEVYSGERFTSILYPDTEINDSVIVEYYDLRKKQLVGTNTIPIHITPLGIDELTESNSLTLLGNPVDDILILHSDNLDKVDVKLFNYLGKEVLSFNLNTGISYIPISITPGSYILVSEKGERINFIKL